MGSLISWGSLRVCPYFSVEINDGKFWLKERAPGVSIDEIVAKTAGEMVVPEVVVEMGF